ncbi:uncharacterized protein LOC126741423 [Anthonomus grandis grandis]|uniref:uncharacterized protein LOC126741423 n=1 Tax=Anthonomus grandis grandis TaxID=2921223 RepID=UPI002165B65E|nr:uncharacterized protein LOC126741423 [Anthonomus grandis grandis]
MSRRKTKQSSEDVDPNEIEILELKHARKVITDRLNRFVEFLYQEREKDILNLDEFQIECRLKSVEEDFSEFDKTQTRLEFLDSTEIDYRLDTESCFYNQISQAKKLISLAQTALTQQKLASDPRYLATEAAAAASSSQAGVRVVANSKIPDFALPSFHGNYESWYSFKDVFSSIVGNKQDISDIDKLLILKSCCKDDAKKLIDSIELTSDNYTIAFELLMKRYENRRAIINTHVNKILFDLPNVQKESSFHLRKLLDTLHQHLAALEKLKLPVRQWDVLLIPIIVQKLDDRTKREWENKQTEQLPTLEQLKEFLTKKCFTLEAVQVTDTQKSFNTQNKNSYNQNSQHKVAQKYLQKGNRLVSCPNTQFQDNNYSNDNNNSASKFNQTNQYSGKFGQHFSCFICKQNHPIFTCPIFINLPISEKYAEINKNKLCSNCLRPGHLKVNCLSRGCKICNRKHNTSLHTNENQIQNKNMTLLAQTYPQQHGNFSNNHNQTPCVFAQNSNHEAPRGQGLLEPEIKNNREVSNTKVNVENPHELTDNNQRMFTYTTLSTNQVLLSTSSVLIQDSQNKWIKCNALLDSGSQCNLMSQSLFNELNLKSERIDIPLSGINQIETKITSRTKTTIKSRFNSFKMDVQFLVLPQITEKLPIFKFEKSEIQYPRHLDLADEQFNTPKQIDLLLGAGIYFDLLQEGIIRLGKNMPILKETVLGWILTGNLNLNTDMYQRQVCNVATKISNKQLQDSLLKFWQIEELEAKNILSKNEQFCEEYFKNTTKRNEDGSFIVKYPFLEEDKDRLGNSKITALKRFNSLEKRLNRNETLRNQYIEFMENYESLGHMTLKGTLDTDNSIDNRSYFLPHTAVLRDSSLTTKCRVVFDASAKTNTNISLNDIILAGPTIQEDLFSILLRLRLRKHVLSADIKMMYRCVQIDSTERSYQQILWRKDSKEKIKVFELNTVTYGTSSAPFQATRCLLELSLQYKDNNSQDENLVLFHDQKELKTLGIKWDPNEDVLKYAVTPYTNENKITKRNILSTIAQIFDPLGLIGPSIIKAKLIMQQLWHLKIDWDEDIPNDLKTAWLEFILQIDYLNKIRIPRQVLLTGIKNLELYGFCDSSEKAYGACVYVGSMNNNKNQIRLLTAKSRVAPLKKQSLPRLELLAAHLLAELIHKLQNILDMNISKITYFSDSTIVLSWLRIEPCHLKTFVANRVARITQISDVERWRHVRSKDNAADIISRGLNPKELSENYIWFNGPEFLKNNNVIEIPYLDNSDELPDLKLTLLLARETNTGKIDIDIFERFSSFIKLLRVFAYILRFKDRVLNKVTQSSIELTVTELTESQQKLIKLAQSESFPEEISRLNIGKTLNKNSKILSLRPFLDQHKIVRVGGRLSKSEITFNQRHPIILPYKHKLTDLIILDQHTKYLHAGTQNLLSIIRLTYWPINGKNAVKRIVKSCLKCYRNNPKPCKFLMGDLPSARVNPSRPFSNCGVDYAGPIYVKEGTLRRSKIVKTYLCIFVCFSTKAIHIELARDLTTPSFLNCLKRLCSRRGKPSDIFSDNGLNFIGANNQFLELYNTLNDCKHNETVSRFLSGDKIKWHFIPARSAHMGGLWEAAVKSVKFHLKRVIGDASLTYEEMYTVLVQIEACLNSRPLTPISTDPNDFQPLTPSHFLIGDSLASLPEENITDLQMTRLSRYQHMQQLYQQFWVRWSRDYLCQLQTRSKWKTDQDNSLKVGALVVLMDDNWPPLKWTMARIVDIHKGADNIVRVVSVRLPNGTVSKRAINKVCLLPIE